MNKKYLFRTALCALAAIVSACSSDELVEKQSSRKQITMTASDFKFADESRTSINITSGGGAFNWAENDTVGIFPNEGAQAYFPMISGAGTNKASFNGGGWALKPSSTYAAFYPYNFYNRDPKAIPVNLEGQTQVGNASTAHFGKYDYMAAIATTPQKGNVNFEFQHLCALVELNIPVPNKGDLTSVTLSSDKAIFTTKGTVDLTSDIPSIAPATTSKSINVSLSHITTAADNESVKVYLMVAPTDLTGKTINASIENNGVELKGVVESKNLEAGKIYRLEITLHGHKPKPSGNYYNVEIAGSLSKMIPESQKYRITELTLSGNLNGTDISFIREMIGLDKELNKTPGILTSLNLYDTNIVEGGEYYLSSRWFSADYKFTKNSVIGKYMFCRCKYLKKIILPKHITTIEEAAFCDCPNLTEIKLSNDITTIGKEAFKFTGLTNITLPSELINIEYQAFKECKLKSVTLPNKLEKIGDGAFDCYDIQEFKGKFASIDNNYISINNRLIAVARKGYSGLTTFTIPDNITAIGESVFSTCLKLTTVNLPRNLQHIGKEAFSSCRILNNITLPSSLLSIGEGAFKNCESIQSIALPDGIKDIPSQTFLNCTKLENVQLSKNLETIGYNAFQGCCFESINIPENVTNISEMAFNYCSNLKEITLPESVVLIGKDVFKSCTNLKVIKFKSGRTVIPENFLADIGDISIESIYIPSTIKEIRTHAFPYKFGNLYCFGEQPPMLYNNGIFTVSKIYVPKNSLKLYTTSNNWDSHAAYIFEMPTGITEP